MRLSWINRRVSCEIARNERATGRVLFVQHCSNYTGSTISGHLLVAGLHNSGWDVHVAFGFSGPYAAEYEAIGCETSVVKHNNWLRGGNVQQSFRRTLREIRTADHFTRLLKEIQPDVVYVNSLVSLAAAVAARRAGIPCIWHVRELFDDVGGEMRIPSLGGRWLVRKALARYADHLVVISKAVAENIAGPGSPLPMTVIPNAVDDSFFEFEETQQQCRLRLGLPLDGPVIGVPGTLRPVKGHPFFLRAARLLRNSYPKCVFAITGDGCPQYKYEIVSQAHTYGLGDNVRFLGTVTAMDSFYRACDIVCVPSISESFGRTIVEAFAIGTPVVATAVGGICETVDDGQTGLLVTYGDVDGLAAAIRNVLSDINLWTRLAVNAKRKADEEYRTARYQQRVHNVITAVAECV